MIQFKELGHTYTDESGILTSVTTLLKKLEPKKDWDEIARKYAKKNKLTFEEVRKLWDHEKDISIRRGSKFHAASEALDLNTPFAAVFAQSTDKMFSVFPATIENGVKFGDRLILEEGIYPELLVWLNSARIAGQVDRAEIIDNTVNIVDYKTNKKIDKSSYVNREGLSEKLLSPCAHLDNCNFNIYSLQLNIYAYIILRNNPYLKLGKMILRHVRFENENNIDEATSFTDYIVPDLQKEAYYIIESHKNKIL